MHRPTINLNQRNCKAYKGNVCIGITSKLGFMSIFILTSFITVSTCSCFGDFVSIKQECLCFVFLYKKL